MLPPLSFAYFSGFVFIALGVILIAALVAWWITPEYDNYKFGLPLVATIIFIAIFVIGGIAGSAIFTSSARYQQIGEVEIRDFNEDVVELDTSQIPVVDLELAAKLADKRMGENLAMGSQMEVGEFTNKQQINGELYYVAPLEHRSFWKWMSNSNGTAGYVKVSATNPNEVEFIQTVDEKELKLKYINSGCFGDDLKRHLRFNGYLTTGLDEYSFELDDEGNPYWVVTTYRNTLLWRCPEATGVVICDPQTGKCEWYSVNDAPEWVDIIQPEKFVIKQIENYGKYVHGVMNFSDKDKLSMTEHITTVYNEGECFYYTGMSSVGGDDGTVGFIMVNTRTKKPVMYRMVGSTEEAAMRSAEGKVQNMGYVATTPIPLNVSGIPTYFCTLKDNEGLVKAYAMLKIEDYGVVGSASTVAATKRAYLNEVNSSGTRIDFGDEAYGYTSKGIVTRITANVEGGETYYYFILDEDSTKLYMAPYMISEELPITREGDTVEVSYVDEKNGTINIVRFDNIAFSQTISQDQEKLNEEQEAGNIINDPDNNVIEVNPDQNQEAWDSLTEEEKAKILEQIQSEE